MPNRRSEEKATRESRGPETGRFLEDDTSGPPRSPLTRKKRPKREADNRAPDEFDDDLVR